MSVSAAAALSSRVAQMDQKAAVAYLRALGLVEPRDMVRGHLRLRDHSRRNSNVSVASDRVGYFVKQATEQDAVATLRSEAEFYELVSAHPHFSGVRDNLPELVHIDVERVVLVTKHLGDGVSLYSHHMRTGQFSKMRARQLACLLACLHEAPPTVARDAGAPSAIWAASLAQPSVELLGQASSANLQLAKTIQRHEGFADDLLAVQADWSPKGLVHGDLKWDNILVGRQQRWWLLDWELWGAGDPRWDVGCAIAEYLRCWIMTAPITGSTEPSSVPNVARYRLEILLPAIGAFCSTYARSRKVDIEFFAGASRFAAARLVQTIYEHMTSSVALSSQAICLLQLARNMLRRPVESLFELLGARAWT